MNPIWKWTQRVVIWSVLLVVSITGITYAAGAVAKSRLARQNPPPGALVDVGGYRMHLYCAGQGSPSVILDAGINEFSVWWALVQPEVARTTQVCSYDRAGLGWSDASPHPRTNGVMVDELHTLLANGGVQGPFILVGHSFGGINVRLYARTYPEDVIGLVLVDSAHEQQAVRMPYLRRETDALLAQFHTLWRMSSFGLMALSPGSIPNRGLPEAAYAQYKAVVATTDYFGGAIAESSVFYSGASAPTVGGLGDLPLRVLSHGLPDMSSSLPPSEQTRFEQEWSAMQEELAGLSSNSEHIIAAQSGHYIHLDQPELVIDAILGLVRSAP